MPTTNPFANVPPVTFVVDDASAIESAIITAYESYYLAGTGTPVTLAPGDPVTLFLQCLSSLISQQRALINAAGLQNFLAYSVAPYLDNLGALYGARGLRLPASSALTTLQFNLSGILASAIVVPALTQVSTADGKFVFQTQTSLTIPAGQTSGTVTAICTVMGFAANGYVVGQVNQLVNFSSPFVVSASNTTITAGGADTEEDDDYRQRLYLVPDSFSVAGPIGAYEFWAYSANPAIMDVAVYGPPTSPAGQAHVVILLDGGSLPTSTVLNQVYNVVNANNIRPLTDFVFVEAPVTTGYSLNVQYWIDSENIQLEQTIITNVSSAIQNWITYVGTAIGRSIIPSKLVQMIMEAGADRVLINSPPYINVGLNGLGVCTGQTITFMGLEADDS
jgi:phage-related baseplate assembly protein